VPFGMVSGVSRGMGVLDGVVIVKEEGTVFGVNLGHPVVINGNFVAYSSCVEVCELIKLSFEVESGVGGGMGILDGVHVPQGEGRVSGGFSPIGFNGIFV